MKLAIALRGIAFSNDTSGMATSQNVSYKTCINSLKDNVINPLKEKFDQIDIFLVTYKSEGLDIEELKRDYLAVDSLLYEKEVMFQSIPIFRRVSKLLNDSITLIKNNDANYDFILITRFDLYFYRKLRLDDFDFTKINFGWTADKGQNDDNFILFDSKFADRLAHIIQSHQHPHSINGIVGHDLCSYVSRPLVPAEGYNLPDFYYFARHMEECRDGRMKLF
jgi:hypothetical protein